MGVLVKMEHCRKVRNCAQGTRRFFKRHKLDFKEFLKNGIDSEKLLEACGHEAMAKMVVKVAEEENGG